MAVNEGMADAHERGVALGKTIGTENGIDQAIKALLDLNQFSDADLTVEQTDDLMDRVQHYQIETRIMCYKTIFKMKTNPASKKFKKALNEVRNFHRTVNNIRNRGHR